MTAASCGLTNHCSVSFQKSTAVSTPIDAGWANGSAALRRIYEPYFGWILFSDTGVNWRNVVTDEFGELAGAAPPGWVLVPIARLRVRKALPHASTAAHLRFIASIVCADSSVLQLRFLRFLMRKLSEPIFSLYEFFAIVKSDSLLY